MKPLRRQTRKFVVLSLHHLNEWTRSKYSEQKTGGLTRVELLREQQETDPQSPDQINQDMRDTSSVEVAQMNKSRDEQDKQRTKGILMKETAHKGLNASSAILVTT